MKKTIYALGFFDGVHLGHQALLTACRQLAQENGCDAGVVTFTAHPDTLVLGQTPKLLTTAADRKSLLSQFHIDTVVELVFDETLMKTHWSVFLSSLVTGGAAGFVCGDDFRFGAGGLGTPKKLQAFCKKRELPCVVVSQQEVDGIRVSSTHIRSLIEQGDVENAARFLGHPHIFTGTVVTGRGLGHTIGIPTANMALPPQLLQPKAGVYACTAHVNGHTYVAVTNIGSRPTVGGHEKRAESWLLDFDGDLYGKTLTLGFLKYLRPEEKFNSLEELQAQIRQDAATAYALFR